MLAVATQLFASVMRTCMQTVNHTYAFFDFQPAVPDSISFEPCIMLPGASGCECLKLGCAVDQHAFRPQLEDMQAADAEPQLAVNVSKRECPTPAGYVRRGVHTSALIGACACPLSLPVPLWWSI